MVNDGTKPAAVKKINLRQIKNDAGCRILRQLAHAILELNGADGVDSVVQGGNDQDLSLLMGDKFHNGSFEHHRQSIGSKGYREVSARRLSSD
jgi:hypothetical protein